VGEALPVIGLVAGIAGAGVSAAGQYGSMQSQSANAAYQAQVAANNAKIALQNQSWDVQAGEVQAGNQGLKTRSMVGTTKAQQGASGVDVNSASSTAVRSGESELGMLDALTIRSDAAKKAYAASVQATSSTAESGLLSSESTQAANAAPVAATGSLLSSASSVAGNYGKYLDASNWNTSLPTGSLTGI
jgi:hypothetical protein